MSDGDALLRAILEFPDEDVPRLAYADWLEEHGDGARAEFIRVQCDLAPHCTRPRVGRLDIPTHRCVKCNALWTEWENYGSWSLACADAGPCCDNVAMGGQIVRLDAATVELFRREADLLARNWTTWFHAAVPGGRMSNGGPIPYFVLTDYRFVNIEVTRGFISEVTLAADCFVGGGVRCRDCENRAPDWETGAVECRRCDGTGILCEPIAADLFAMHPITRVDFEDREPGQVGNTREWYWVEETIWTTDPRHTLPAELFRLMSETIAPTRVYSTRDQAVHAASDAAVAHGRKLAGLAPIAPVP